MNFKKTPASPRGHSGVLNEDADDGFELTLYDELVAFTESPESDRDHSDDDFDDLGRATPDIEPEDVELPDIELPDVELPGFAIEAAPSAPAVPELLSQMAHPSVDDASFEALEDLANTVASQTTNRPVERLDDSAFQAVPVPQLRNTSDLNRELAEMLKGTGPLDPSKAQIKKSGPLNLCPECKSVSGPDDLFCLACGALLGEADLELEDLALCSECGAATTSDEVFCASCGAVLPESH